jgi:hypothetical protein
MLHVSCRRTREPKESFERARDLDLSVRAAARGKLDQGIHIPLFETPAVVGT